ncbi:hypothetical protein QUB70_01535 [Microcoleus sp. A003_D6]
MSEKPVADCLWAIALAQPILPKIADTSEPIDPKRENFTVWKFPPT